MTENEYLTLENLIRLRDAGSILSQVVSGYGLTEEERVGITSRILAITERISNAIEVREEGGE